MLDLQSFKDFTPGKWAVGWPDGSGNGEWDGTYSIVSNGESIVVRSGDSFGLNYGLDIKANAALIAAAPDLLSLAIKQEAEIKWLRNCLHNIAYGDYSDISLEMALKSAKDTADFALKGPRDA